MQGLSTNDCQISIPFLKNRCKWFAQLNITVSSVKIDLFSMQVPNTKGVVR